MSAKAIGTLGQVNTIYMGGYSRVVDGTEIFLSAFSSDVTTNVRSNMRKGNGSAGYQVTAGKTLTLQAYRLLAGALATTDNIRITRFAQTDTDIGVNVSTAFGTPVYFGGFTSGDNMACVGNPNVAGGEDFSSGLGLGFTCAATKYVGVELSGSGGKAMVQTICTEA